MTLLRWCRAWGAGVGVCLGSVEVFGDSGVWSWRGWDSGAVDGSWGGGEYGAGLTEAGAQGRG